MALQKSTEVNGGICDGTCAAANARTHAGVDAGTSPTGTAEKRIKALLTYPPGAVGKPITYSLVRQFDLWINILHAEIAADKAGRLIMDILGDASNVDRGLAFLEEEGIEYEILNGSALWDEDRCVHCGACTAVCPSHALTLDKNDWSLAFDREKCYLCRLCTRACPVGAMSTPI
jgi:ferredoxin